MTQINTDPIISQPTRPDLPLEEGFLNPDPIANPDPTVGERQFDLQTMGDVLEDKPTERTAALAFQDFLKNPAKAIPFVGSIIEARSLLKTYDASKRLEAGTDTPQDRQLLLGLIQRAQQETTVRGTVVDILTQLPAFAGEIAATGGLFTAGRKITTKAIGKIIRGSLERNIGRAVSAKVAARVAGKSLLTKAAGVAAGSIAPTAALPQRVASSTIRRALPQIGTDEAGQLAVEFDRTDENFRDAMVRNLPAGFLDSYIEIWSERTGGALKFLPGASKLAGLKAAIAKRWLQKNPTSTLRDLSKKIAGRAAWNGVIGEMFEERVGEVARGVTGLEPYTPPTPKQLLAEAIAFAIPGATVAAADITFRKRPAPQAPQPTPEAPAAPVAAVPTEPTEAPEAGAAVAVLAKVTPKLRRILSQVRQLAAEGQTPLERPEAEAIPEAPGRPPDADQRTGGFRTGDVMENTSTDQRFVVTEESSVGVIVAPADAEGKRIGEAEFLIRTEDLGSMRKAPTEAEARVAARQAKLPDVVPPAKAKAEPSAVSVVAVEGKPATMVEFRKKLADVRRRVLTAQRAKEDVREGVQAEIRDLVVAHVPKERRGKFLTAVLKAKTMGALTRSINKMRREIVLEEGTETVKSIAKSTKGRKLRKKLTVERRTEVRKMIVEAKKLKKELKSGRSPDALLQTVDKLVAVDRAIKEVFADHAAETAVIAKGKARTIQQLVDTAEGNINKGRPPKPPPETGEPPEAPVDRQVNWFRGLARGLHDLPKILQDLDGNYKGLGILFRLVYTRMVRAEDRYTSAKRDLQTAVEAIVKKAGFKSLSEAQLELSTALGRTSTKFVNITFGKTKHRLPLGEALGILAMDEPTLELVDRGARVQRTEGRQTETLELTRENIEELRGQVEKANPKLLTMISDLKELIESQRSGVWAVLRRVNGWTPDFIKGYWPRVRNRLFSEKRGLPQGWRQTMEHYLENLSLTKERTPDLKSPLVITDLLTTAFNTLDNMVKITHLAEPIRDASAVVFNSRIIVAINKRFGSQVNSALVTFLSLASRANEYSGDIGARTVGFLNSNFAVSALSLNPTSWLVQLGGLFRLAATMDRQDFLAGVKGASKISMEKLVAGSGFFWERYVGRIFGRFTPTAPEVGTTVDTDVLRAVDLIIDNLMQGRFREANKAWGALTRKTMGILNLFDGINAKVAYAGSLAKLRRLNPGRSEASLEAAAMARAADLIRGTQNSTSPLDFTMFAAQSRQSVLGAFFLFTSDVLKARNRIVRAWQRSPTSGATHTAAELLNIAYVISVRRGYQFAFGMGVAALLGSDPDDTERLARQGEDLDRLALDTVTEILQLVDPLITGNLARAAGFGGSIVDFPLLGAGEDIGKGIKDLYTAAGALSERDKDKFIRRGLTGLDKIASTSVSVFLGNPLQSQWRRLTREVERNLIEPGALTYDRDTEFLRDEYNLLHRMRAAETKFTPRETSRWRVLKQWKSDFLKTNLGIRENRSEENRKSELRKRNSLQRFSASFRTRLEKIK